MVDFGNKLPFAEKGRRKKKRQHNARNAREVPVAIQDKILKGIFLTLICNGDFLCKTRKVRE